MMHVKLSAEFDGERFEAVNHGDGSFCLVEIGTAEFKQLDSLGEVWGNVLQNNGNCNNELICRLTDPDKAMAIRDRLNESNASQTL